MPEETKGIWLGSRRKLARTIMIFSALALLALSVWLIFGRLFLGTGIGLKQFLSPAEHPQVLVTMLTGCLVLISAGVYFSDIQGRIEPEPEGFFDVFSLIWARISMIAIVVVVCVMFYEVVSRYIFVNPTLWANELSLWIAGFIFLLAGLYAMQQRSHIRIFILHDMVPRWLQKVFDVISALCIWLFVGAVIWGGYGEAMAKLMRWERFGTAWDPPIPATLKPLILITLLFMALQVLSNLIHDWNRLPEHHTPADDLDMPPAEVLSGDSSGPADPDKT